MKAKKVRKKNISQRKQVEFDRKLERILQQAIEYRVTDRKIFRIYLKLLRRADIDTLRYLARQERQEQIDRRSGWLCSFTKSFGRS
jgi:hypothetical protein